MKEIDLERACINYCETHNIFIEKQDPLNRIGHLDIKMKINSNLIFVELKTVNGRLSKEQIYKIVQHIWNNDPVYVITNIKEFKKIVSKWKKIN